MVENTKIEIIKEYLTKEFLGCEVLHINDFDHISEEFIIVDGDKRYTLTFRKIFFETNSDVNSALQNLELGKSVRLSEHKKVVVGKNGISFE